MKQVTIVGAPTPSNEFERWVLNTLSDLANASGQNTIEDVADSGATLATIANAEADQFPYYTGPTSVALTALTALARTLLADAAEADMRTTLKIADQFLAIANNLSEIAASGAAAQLAARGNLGLDTASLEAAEFFLQTANNLSEIATAGAAAKLAARSNLGLAIGTDVLAYDAQLFSNIPIGNGGSFVTSNYACVAADAQKMMVTQTNGVQFTIPANSSVPYPVGTALTFCFFNGTAGNTATIVCGDTMYLAGTALNGTRTMGNGMVALATAIKLSSVNWVISGSGLS